MSKNKVRNMGIFKKDPKVERLFEIVEGFYGLSKERIMETSSRNAELVKVRSMLYYKIVSMGYVQADIAKYFGVNDWNVHLGINRMKDNPDWLEECINVFND